MPLLAVFLIAAPASAREVAVGTIDDILSAVRNAKPGDVITIAPGRYVMPPIRPRESGKPDHPITLRATQPGTVELASTAVEFIKVSGSDWIFENLDIAGICATDDDCEHAFHVVSGADRTVIRHNRIRDYNAHIKGNGEGGRFPNDVLIEGNLLFGTHVRQTDNPIAPIDVVGGRRWIARGNFIADYGKSFDHPATRTDDYGYALFFKGNATATVIEDNIVLCADQLPHQPYTRGLSLGGSATGPQYCEGHCNDDETRGGIIRNNVVAACPTGPGIYLYRAAESTVTGNRLLDTEGILAMAPDASGSIDNNLLTGGIIESRGGASLEQGPSNRFDARPQPPEAAAREIAAYRAYWAAKRFKEAR